jgi:hypothetical protein
LQVTRQFGAVLKSNDLVRVTEGSVTTGANDQAVLIVAAMELVSAAAAAAAAPAAEAAAKTPAKTPAAALKPAPRAPGSGPEPPATGSARAPARAPAAGATPRRAPTPISSLNPYMHGWAVRARVVAKGQKRAFNGGGGGGVFSAELVDAAGTAIEATFWREAADRFFDVLEEGRVFTFARGAVKVANKRWSQVRAAVAFGWF